MRKRAWLWVLLLGAICAGVPAALGWLTLAALELEAVQRAIERDSATQNAARLALWRLDSAALPLLAPLPDVASDPNSTLGAVQRVGQQRFDVMPEGQLRWRQGDPAEAFAPLQAQLAEQGLARWWPEALQTRPMLSEQVPAPHEQAATARNWIASNDAAQLSANQREFQVRALNTYQVQQQILPPPAAAAHSRKVPQVVGADHLLLLWQGVERGQVRREGSVLDWPALQAALLQEIGDLLPQASLQLIPPDRDVSGSAHRMSVLPVLLVPGEVPAPPQPGSPIRLALAVAWMSLGLGVVAIGLLVGGALRLSRRRAAFVQAVTHEMRTPLTTFQLYTDLLADERVIERAQQRRYIATLQREAQRLRHLVENVLTQARLERQPRARAGGPIPLGELVDHAWERLRCRAEQSGRPLQREVIGAAAMLPVRAERDAVEQILLNLVDNACRHGGDAAALADPRIALVVTDVTGRGRRRWGVIQVIDHGPGIPAAGRRRLFRPFGRVQRPGESEARPASGIGLGLAISRRLARGMGGELLWLPPAPASQGEGAPAAAAAGAVFALRLRSLF